MIEPLDPSVIEDALAAYLNAAAPFAAVKVPAKDPDDPDAVPMIVVGLDKSEIEAHTITVAITAPELEQEALGFYQPEVHFWVITPATVESNKRAHHLAVVKALGKCFPNRPAPSSDDLPAWEVIHAAVSAAITAKEPDWAAAGWYCKTGAYAKDDVRWEQRLTLTLGLSHSSV